MSACQHWACSTARLASEPAAWEHVPSVAVTLDGGEQWRCAAHRPALDDLRPTLTGTNEAMGRRLRLTHLATLEA